MVKDKDVESAVSASNGGGSPPPQSTQTAAAPKFDLHPAFYVGIWIFFSGSVILFNKWVLDTAGFRFPIFLTTWHLVFATIMTQILARTTNLLDGLKTVPMDGRTYLNAIVPIGVFFCLSLICSNQAYLYLSVAFIQMLKACMPVGVLLTSWAMKTDTPNMRVLANVSVIVLGVVVASYGEIAFVVIGVVFQVFGLLFESVRLVMVQKLLSGSEYKMDPLVSLYYFAPVCAAMNAICCIIFEGPRLSLQAILDAGLFMLFMNAAVAFCLNVAVVFLIGKTSSLVLTLSGILKDILLVFLSVLIWSTPITAIQMFGYAIALAGLIYYKIGGEQAHAAYKKITGDDDSTFNRFRRSLWAKIGAGVLVTFVVLALVHGLSRGRGIDTASTQTGLTGNPEPEMVDAYNPPIDSEMGYDEAHDLSNFDPAGSSGSHYETGVVDDVTHHSGTEEQPAPHYTTGVVHDVSYRPTHPLDVVLYIAPGTSNATIATFEEILTHPSISTPRVIAYGHETPSFGVDRFVQLNSIISPSLAYLDYITTHYDELPEHTIFLHTDVDARHLPSTILTRYRSQTGVAELSAGGYAICNCLDCLDSLQSNLPKASELYSLTNQNICSANERLLLSEDSLFIASAARIRRNPVAVYTHLANALEEREVGLEQTIEKSWLYMLGCNDVEMGSRCRGAGSTAEECQCLDPLSSTANY